MDERAPTLLVIEDAADTAVLVGVAARHAHPGLEVHIAHDGAVGIEYLEGISPLQDPPRNPTPDIVILDLMMPVVDGFGVLEWIHDKLGKPDFPVVVFTATPSVEYEERARALGATEFYQKPGDVSALAATVKKIVTRWINPNDILAAHLRASG
jgi:DNA-binding response OmpR family regulator